MAIVSGALGTLARTGNEPRPKSRRGDAVQLLQNNTYFTYTSLHWRSRLHHLIQLFSCLSHCRLLESALVTVVATRCCPRTLVPCSALRYPKSPPALPHTRRLIHPQDTRAASPSATLTMIQGTRRWFKRNRTNFAIGAGVLGAGYLAGQYLLGKLGEARQRMSDDRIAKEKCAVVS